MLMVEAMVVNTTSPALRNEQPMKVMKKSGFVELVGEENFCSNISDALKHAEELISR